MSRGELDDNAIRAIIEKFEIMRAAEQVKCEGGVVQCCWLRVVPTKYLTVPVEVDLSQGEPRRGKIEDVQVKDCLDTKVA
jgi:hypothetical protein